MTDRANQIKAELRRRRSAVRARAAESDNSGLMIVGGVSLLLLALLLGRLIGPWA